MKTSKILKLVNSSAKAYKETHIKMVLFLCVNLNGHKITFMSVNFDNLLLEKVCLYR